MKITALPFVFTNRFTCGVFLTNENGIPGFFAAFDAFNDSHNFEVKYDCPNNAADCSIESATSHILFSTYPDFHYDGTSLLIFF